MLEDSEENEQIEEEAKRIIREQKALELISELTKKHFKFTVDSYNEGIIITLDASNYTKEELEYVFKKGFDYEDCVFSYKFE